MQQPGSPEKGADDGRLVLSEMRGEGRSRDRAKGLDRAVISLRRMTLGSGYRYLMESVAVGDGAPGHSSNLTRYYAESGTPPGVFLGAGLAGLDDGRGVEHGSAVTEEHLFNLLGMCADPVTGKPLGRQPNRAHLSLSKRVAQRMAAIPATHTVAERAEESARIEAEERVKGGAFRTPVAGFDLTFSPSKSVSTAWALADRDTKEQIYACHRRAIEVVLAYAEREVFHSRSGTNGVVQEDVEGVVAAAFTHWDSRAGDPQLHDHVVVANRAQSVSDGTWRTLDSRGLFKSLVALSELHQGVLSDLLTASLGWGWDGRSRRHSEQLRFEVTGVSEALMAEFSQRSVAIEERKSRVGQPVRPRSWAPTKQCGGTRAPPSGHLGDPAGQGAPQLGRDDGILAAAGGELHRSRPGLLGRRTGRAQRPSAPARRRPGRWHFG